MTSIFTLIVARGVEVPAIDPRIEAHVDVREVSSTEVGPAALADGSFEVQAPAAQPASGTSNAPISGDGTQTTAN